MHKFFYPLLLLLLGWILAGSYFAACPTCNPVVAAPKDVVIAAPPAPVAKVKNKWNVNDGDRFTAGSPNFFTFPVASDAPNVPPKTQEVFDKVAKYMRANPERQLLLTGFYKDDENQSYQGDFDNLGVSRAEAIKSNLVERGAAGGNIITTGLEDYNLKATPKNMIRNGVSFNFRGSDDLTRIAARLKAEPYMIYFQTGSNQVTMEQKLKDYFADIKYYVSQVPEAAIQVSGHTDNVGSQGGNTRLSKKRAKMVRDYMVRQGIKKSAITDVVGEGPDRPIESNDTDAGKAKNRRVEIIVTN